MKRRQLLTAGAGIASALPFAQMRTDEHQQDRSLTEILPPEAVIPDEFEPLGPPERRMSIRTSIPHDTQGIDATAALQEHGIGGDESLTRRQGRLETQARLARDNERTPDGLDAHHERVLEEAFPGQGPAEEHFTDWCETQLIEETVGGRRRSEFWLRAPELRQQPGREDSADTSRPYREYALVIQSTDWGPLSVEIERTGVSERGELYRLATRLMKEMQLATVMGPPPTRGAGWDTQ